MFKKLFSFSLLGLIFSSCEGLKKGFHIESDLVMFYSGFPATASIVAGADASSFEAINDEYGKDKKHVFYRRSMIINADPDTFEVLGGAFSRDKNHGYAFKTYQEIIPVTNDPAHFEIVPNMKGVQDDYTDDAIIYARDREHVYSGSEILTSADPATFFYVPMRAGTGFSLARDKQFVYWRDTPIPEADGSTFKVVSYDYFKDKNAVWGTSIDNRGNSSWAKLPDTDVATFEVIGKDLRYGKDKKHYYYNGNIEKAPKTQ